MEPPCHLDRGVGELAVVGPLAGEDDGVAGRVRAQVDQTGEGRRQSLRCLACGRHGTQEHIALFYRTVG